MAAARPSRRLAVIASHLRNRSLASKAQPWSAAAVKGLALGQRVGKTSMWRPQQSLRFHATQAQANEAKVAPSVMVGVCQIEVSEDKAANLVKAANAVKEAAGLRSQLVVLPECFNSPYDTKQFRNYCEPIPAVGTTGGSKGSSWAAISNMAKDNKVYLVAGSIPEQDGNAIYNTCVVVDPSGKMVAKHRKVHLFDIDVPGKITFKESEILTAGNQITSFDTPFGKVGVGICYDIRFPEYAQLCAQQGCSIIVYPGAFNMTTGPAHWELLQRSRALDNQLYVVTCSPARNPKSSYQAWGHSTISNPWGEVIATTGHNEAIVVQKLDLARVEEVRSQIPCRVQKRHDLYALIKKSAH